MKRPFGVLAEKLTADFALLLLEPVRSAEPARNSIGITAAIASIADSDDLRVAMFCGVSSSDLRFDSVVIRASHSLRAPTPRLPASRQAFKTSSGTENGSSEMPSFSLAPL